MFYTSMKLALVLKDDHRLRTSENTGLRMILASKRYEITKVWRKLHNDEFFYSLANIVTAIKSGRTRAAIHVVRKGRH